MWIKDEQRYNIFGKKNKITMNKDASQKNKIKLLVKLVFFIYF